jgi:hypothetical protein
MTPVLVHATQQQLFVCMHASLKGTFMSRRKRLTASHVAAEAKAEKNPSERNMRRHKSSNQLLY